MIPMTMNNNDHAVNIRLVSTGMKIFWVLVAAAMTVLLFLLMAYLITPRTQPPVEISDNISIDITRQPRNEKPVEKNRTDATKPVQQNTPPAPSIPETRPRMAGNNDLTVGIPDFGDGKNQFSTNADRRATPIVRIPPQYPHTATIKGIEGWVMVEFTITPGGTVADARIVDSEPKGVFDRETLRAIKRWKYQPKIVNGQAVPQYNMRELIQFVLEDA